MINKGTEINFNISGQRLLEERIYKGCTSWGVSFLAILKNLNVPSIIVHGCEDKYINYDIRYFSGHVFVECFINDKWILVDPTLGKIYTDYNPNSIFLPRGYVAHLKGNDFISIGCLTKDNGIGKSMDLFRDYLYDKRKIVSKTVYAGGEACSSIHNKFPKDVEVWMGMNFYYWLNRKDISIFVHVIGDKLTNEIAISAYNMDLDFLDKKTEEENILFWIDNSYKYPTLLISAIDKLLLESELETNDKLNALLEEMFYIEDKLIE